MLVSEFVLDSDEAKANPTQEQKISFVRPQYFNGYGQEYLMDLLKSKKPLETSTDRYMEEFSETYSLYFHDV